MSHEIKYQTTTGKTIYVQAVSNPVTSTRDSLINFSAPGVKAHMTSKAAIERATPKPKTSIGFWR